MYINPITNKKHVKWNKLNAAIGKSIKNLNVNRGCYDEINKFGENISASKILSVFRPALDHEYCSFDKKGRGSALNHDLYGYDPKQGVAVVQARQAIGSKYGMSTRKTYFLVGKNEITNQFFRHPVGSHAIRASIKITRDPVKTVLAAQKWLWEATEKQIKEGTRQGDILFVPEKEPRTAAKIGMGLTVEGSHKILADEIRKNGKVYALNPRAIHSKNQHSPVVLDGWFSIRVAREATAWDFAQRVGD